MRESFDMLVEDGIIRVTKRWSFNVANSHSTKVAIANLLLSSKQKEHKLGPSYSFSLVKRVVSWVNVVCYFACYLSKEAHISVSKSIFPLDFVIVTIKVACLVAHQGYPPVVTGEQRNNLALYRHHSLSQNRTLVGFPPLLQPLRNE